MLPVWSSKCVSRRDHRMRAFKDGADGYLNKESASGNRWSRRSPQGRLGRQVSVARPGRKIALEIGTKNDRALHEGLSDRVRNLSQTHCRHQPKGYCRAAACQSEDRDDLPGAHPGKTGLASNAELTRYMVENNLLD